MVGIPLFCFVFGVECTQLARQVHQECTQFVFVCLRVDFLMKTDSGYPKDAEVTLFTLATPGSSLRFNTHWSAPPVSALARARGSRKRSQSPVSRNSNIERRWTGPSP